MRYGFTRRIWSNVLALIALVGTSAGLPASAANPATLPIGSLELPQGTKLVGAKRSGMDFELYRVIESSTNRVLLGIYVGHAPHFPLVRIPEIRRIGPCIGLYSERYYSSTIDDVFHRGVEWGYLIELRNDTAPLSVHFFIPGDGSDEASVERAKGLIRTLVLLPGYRCASIAE